MLTDKTNNCICKTLDHFITGEELFRIFSDETNLFFLDGGINNSDGRYSYLGFDPFDVVEYSGKDCLEVLGNKFYEYKHATEDCQHLFQSGIVGCLGYDYGVKQETICPSQEKEPTGLPDCFFGFYDNVIVVDNKDRVVQIFSSGLPEKNIDSRMVRAEHRIEKVIDKINNAGNNIEGTHQEKLCFKLHQKTNRKDYNQAVEKALEYIACGDIYQVNYSHQFQADIVKGTMDPSDIYLKLRKASPSAFGGYMDCGKFQIISSSPEQFLKLTGQQVITKPMKGTRPRYINDKEDIVSYQELESSPKDKAELLMITDLERNDLGKVCKYGSVKVTMMRDIEKYSTVFQAVSLIEGILKDERDCFDLLQATFPGGSITGCPKIRSMEIIEELEQQRRGFYTGAMGYIDFSGDMQMSILIRTMLIKNSKIYFNVGGGIVADSTPDGEYEETLVKAKAMLECLRR